MPVFLWRKESRFYPQCSSMCAVITLNWQLIEEKSLNIDAISEQSSLRLSFRNV